MGAKFKLVVGVIAAEGSLQHYFIFMPPGSGVCHSCARLAVSVTVYQCCLLDVGTVHVCVPECQSFAGLQFL